MSDRPESEHDPKDDPTLSEQVGEAIRSEDEPLGKVQPEAPLAMVMGLYPIVLIIALLLIALFFLFPRGGEDEDEPATDSVPANVIQDESSTLTID